MKTILVPTDFSATAMNAADYAIGFAKQMNIDKIILYNSWQPITIADPMATLIVSEIDSIKTASLSQLDKEIDRLKTFCPIHIQLEAISDMHTLTTGLEELCKSKTIEYIIMGITGGDSFEEKLMGSNTITVSQIVEVPVIIVPRECEFKLITKAMLLSDFKNIDTTLPEKPITNFLNAAMPLLEVINFDPNFDREKDEAAFEKFFLNDLFRKYAPEYKYSLRNDFEDAVNEFAENDNVQIIICISKKHSWLFNIFNTSHTQRLAFHTTVPLMVIHS